MEETPHPMQDVEWAGDVIRFRANEIVRYLVDHGGISLNDLAVMGFSDADRMQLAQLIGYSVSGFGDLDYADEDVVHEADRRAQRLVELRRKKPHA